MADDEQEPRPADWEVVQLTASTYAAAPGPEGIAPGVWKCEGEASNSMFMSGHFVFPPSEHENLPIEPAYSEIRREPEYEDVSTFEEEDGGADTPGEAVNRSNSDDDRSASVKNFEEGKGLRELNLIGEEGGVDVARDNDRSASVKNFEEGKGLRELNLIGEEGGVDVARDNDVVSGQSSFSPKCTKESDGDEYDGCGLPCIGWWKRHVACLYRHAKDANTFWSVFVAAALVGLVILGSSASKKNSIFSK